MLADQLEELFNSAWYFSSFCNVQKLLTKLSLDEWNEAKNILGKIGESGSRAFWKEWSYNDWLKTVQNLQLELSSFLV